MTRKTLIEDLALQDQRDAYLRVLRQFVLDVEVAYGADVYILERVWPELLDTYRNALLALRKGQSS